MKIYIFKISKIVSTVAFVLCNYTVSIAQIENSKIKDGTISSGPEKSKPGAIFELESNIKGMLTTRLTTAQRNAIPVANLTDGLLIFNTTTGCFDYWNAIQSLWLSMCGTPPPAVFTISSDQCSTIVASGTYKQGDILTQLNYLTVPVTVTQPGTYTISATTANGYYFEANGTFPAANTYSLLLKSTGRPNSGYDSGNPGDPVTITLNGNVSSCIPHIYVEKANVDFSITCANIAAGGTYYIGLDLTPSNKLSVEVNVTSLGFWSMNTNTLNGYSFNGTGTFSTLGTQTIELIGTGKPITSETNNFNLSSNASTAASCSAIPVTVLPVAYTINCSGASRSGTYMQSVALVEGNTVTIPVNATATGQTTISTNTVNGISFSSGPISITALGLQNIILKGTGTPLTAGTTTLTVTGSPGAAATCSVDIPITAQPVAYTMTCAGVLVSGSYAPAVTMISSNTMTVPVNVTFVGDYTISTNTINGISFSGTGTFSTTGAQNVVLTASGTPTAGGTFNYIVSTNSASSSATCTKSITFVYRTMNVLGLGDGIYQPGTGTTYSSRAILTSSSNFGPSGTVQIQSFNIINGGNDNGTALKNNINNSKIDIIVVGYNYDRSDAATMTILSNFVSNKKGVLIFASERSSAKDVIDAVCGSNVTTTGTNNGYIYNIIGSSDPVINGPFGDLTGRLLGGDGTNSVFVTSATMPSNTTAIATQGSNTYMLKHNTLGFVFLGDGGFTAGYASNTSTTTYPASITGTGLPAAKTYNGGTIYNSAMYANLLAWGVKYSQENTDVDYLIP